MQGSVIGIDLGTTNSVVAVMEGAPHPAVHLDVPLVVDAGQGASWAEAH